MIPYLPIGSIMAYAGDVAPNGWLLCTGDVYYSVDELTGEDTEYKALYDLIGTSYGIGDIEGSFKVPDLRKSFIEGAASDDKVNTVIEAGLVDHNHSFTGTEVTTDSTGSHSHQSGVKRIWDSLDGPWGVAQEKVRDGKYSPARYGEGATYYDIDYTSSDGSHYHTITLTGSIDNASKHNSIYGKSTTVQPNSLCIHYIIKYK